MRFGGTKLLSKKWNLFKHCNTIHKFCQFLCTKIDNKDRYPIERSISAIIEISMLKTSLFTVALVHKSNSIFGGRLYNWRLALWINTKAFKKWLSTGKEIGIIFFCLWSLHSIQIKLHIHRRCFKLFSLDFFVCVKAKFIYQM